MLRHFYLTLTSSLAILCSLVGALPPPSQSNSLAPQHFATQSLPPAAQPSFSTQNRRRVMNCDKDWMKNIEEQAWADAGEIANVAAQWRPEKDETLSWNMTTQIATTEANNLHWQAAMDLYMGKDSINDEVKYKISRALDYETFAHSSRWPIPEAVIDVYCGYHPTYKRACRKRRENKDDPNSPMIQAFATSWVDRGTFWNTYNVVLCDRFFSEKDSLWGTLDLMGKGRIDKTNATAYKETWGHTYYHELMHLDPVVASQEVWDVRYGACNAAKIANHNGCTGTKEVDEDWPEDQGDPNSMNNADSWAMYASAAYFQNAWKLDAPGRPPKCNISNIAKENVALNDVVEGILEPPGVMSPELFSATAPPDPDPSQLPKGTGVVPSLPFNSNSTPTGLATPYANAEAYFASLLDPSSTSISQTPSQRAQCTINQIEGSCTEASYPSMTPNSGEQAPICNKVDDPQNNLLRLNADKAKQAATDYCATLASQKIILGPGSTGPKPASINGAAENNGQLALTVEYNVDGCPQDKSMSAVDFTKMSSEECQQNFFDSISSLCAQDEHWPGYNADYTLEGGVFLNDCGLFAMTGQP